MAHPAFCALDFVEWSEEHAPCFLFEGPYRHLLWNEGKKAAPTPYRCDGKMKARLGSSCGIIPGPGEKVSCCQQDARPCWHLGRVFNRTRFASFRNLYVIDRSHLLTRDFRTRIISSVTHATTPPSLLHPFSPFCLFFRETWLPTKAAASNLPPSGPRWARELSQSPHRHLHPRLAQNHWYEVEQAVRPDSRSAGGLRQGGMEGEGLRSCQYDACAQMPRIVSPMLT